LRYQNFRIDTVLIAVLQHPAPGVDMIIPGIFEQNFEAVEKKVHSVEEFAPLIQIDIADGILVDGKTFDNVKKLGEIQTNSSFEIHLMVENPINYLEKDVHNITRLCTQVEVGRVEKFLSDAKDFGYDVGLSINPDTPIERLNPHLDKIQYVQFMAVVPGGQGRPFEHSILERIEKFKNGSPSIPIQVDGGIDNETLLLVLRAGAENVVIGSHLFKSDNIKDTYEQLNTTKY
jgi:ribulose-phosphate 3-epimerase